MKKVLIRADGNSKKGLGHIYRGLALAEILTEIYRIEFVTKNNSIVSPIQEEGYNYTYIPQEVDLSEESYWFKENYPIDTIIILDGYDFNEAYQQKLKNMNYKIVYIDDLVQGKQKADLVINHCPNIERSDYNTEAYTSLALGLNYALLRKPFLEFDRQNVKIKKKVKNIFISFGGADASDFSLIATTTVLDLSFIESVNVIVGAAYKYKDIFKIQNSKLKVYKNLSAKEVYELMKEADLAIVPASTTSIELASLGIPMILGYFVDNQKRIYAGFTEENLVTGIGNFKDYDFKYLKGVIKALNNSVDLQSQRLTLLSSFKELSKENIIKLFQFEDVLLRKATETDLMFVFHLSNEPLVRSNSYNADNIELDKHKVWFKKQIYQKETLFYIIESQNNPVGQIRFTKKDDYSVIGISISNKFRGKGLASKSLNLGVNKYFQNNSLPIYAYIKKSNESSIRLFKKNGFSLYKEELVEGVDSYIYTREK